MAATASGPDLWTRVRGELKSIVSAEGYALWFEDLAVEELGPDRVVLGVGRDIAEIWITENYLEQLEEIFSREAGRPMRVEVRRSENVPGSRPPLPEPREEDRQAEAARAGAAAAARSRADRARLNGGHRGVRRDDGVLAGKLIPRNTFDTFIVGANSQLAHAAATSVARSPGSAYNPLLVYGDTGLGKTHLMHAVGHYILAEQPEARIAYMTAENFTNDYIEAIKDQQLTRFRKGYRNVDVLLVDDIQFLSGKERIQEEFFHTFNDLHESGKQIFLTSDRPPNEIQNLERRLVTRFQWGLTIDIRPPDLETRIAILRKKAAAIPVSVDAHVLEFVAQHVTSNIRQLEGALLRLAAFQASKNRPADVTAARDLLKDILLEEAHRTVTIERIMKAVADHLRLSVSDLTGRRRPANIALARQVAMFLSRELTRHSLQEIGDAFGGRDHGTVIHAIRQVQNLTGQDHQLEQTVEYLRQALR